MGHVAWAPPPAQRSGSVAASRMSASCGELTLLRDTGHYTGTWCNTFLYCHKGEEDEDEEKRDKMRCWREMTGRERGDFSQKKRQRREKGERENKMTGREREQA